MGPAAAAPYVMSRAVTKREAYKNWRLNGEFIRDPEGQAGRFDGLVPNDLALLDFVGDPVPNKISLLLISQNSPIDAPLHKALVIPGGKKTMIEISRQALSQLVAGVDSAHPIFAFVKDPEFDAALEDAALGGVKGTEQIIAIATKRVSAATLAAARLSAEKSGRDGEALASIHLARLMAEGTITSFEWASQKNAVCPYDFAVQYKSAGKILIDAKSTNGEFERAIHMSGAELMAAAQANRYDLWRIYEINDEGAKLRIARSISEFAKSVLTGIALRDGVAVDSVSIKTSCLTWDPEILINRPEENEVG